MIGTCWCAETTGDKTAAPDEPLSETAVVVVVITLDLSGLLQLPPITSVERERERERELSFQEPKDRDQPVFSAMPKHWLTEFGIHRLFS